MRLDVRHTLRSVWSVLRTGGAVQGLDGEEVDPFHAQFRGVALF